MNFHVSAHAQAEMLRRGIPRAMVDAVLVSPEQIVAEHGGIMCYQSRVTISQKPYLLRVMVNETSLPPVVVTVYRTSKISKYWRQP
jgi:hypothetical protein